MAAQQKKRAYALYSLITTLFEEAVLTTVVLLVLPRFGISIPVWLLLLVIVAWAAYSFTTFRLGERVIAKTPVVSAEALFGVKGMTTTQLSPEGYVRVGAELWRARSVSEDIDESTEVTIIDMQRLTLFVVASAGAG